MLYFPVLLGLGALLGNVALAAVFLPGMAWAVLLSPRIGLVGSLLLIVPNYFIGTSLNVLQTQDEFVQLIASHAFLSFLAYVIGYSYVLRRNLAQELAAHSRSEARFRGLFDTTHDAVLISDMDMVIQDLNDEALRMLGYKRKELIGQPYASIVAANEQNDLQRRVDMNRTGTVTQPFYERTYIRKDGTAITVEVNASLVRTPEGIPLHFQTISRDITERKAAEEDLYFKATHDALTGLYNRAMFADLLDRAIERSRRDKEKMAVLFIDLDKFKAVNDNFGHQLGDLLLQECSLRFTTLLRKSDVVARVGGDEFNVLLEPIGELQFARKVAHNIEATLSAPFNIEGNRIEISASAGIGYYPDDGQIAEELLEKADQQMYEVKRQKQLSEPR